MVELIADVCIFETLFFRHHVVKQNWRSPTTNLFWLKEPRRSPFVVSSENCATRIMARFGSEIVALLSAFDRGSSRVRDESVGVT